MSEVLLEQLKSMRIGLFVVDEAHCIIVNGGMISVLNIRSLENGEKRYHPVALALTATATKQR
ncbi:hypothetical protein ACEQPO_17740 [Bacillus sp. SL00103]